MATKAKATSKRKRGRPQKKKAPGGRPSHQPTDLTRQQVKLLSMTGMYTQPQIAKAVGCNDKTMRKHYRDELDRAKSEVDAQVMGAFIMMATGGGGTDGWKKAIPAATLAYARTHLGLKDQRNVKLSGAVGTFDLSKLSDAELDKLEALVSRVAIIGNAEGGED